jgi:hypothetical protein
MGDSAACASKVPFVRITKAHGLQRGGADTSWSCEGHVSDIDLRIWLRVKKSDCLKI